jgi:superfamily II DNA or RNA helicase|tara:strand:- start:1695 stop:2870 length:1176 start_codon:yes stop_codon:yes gene_type:complete
MLLRPHQQKALDAMLAYDKGQVIIPTGGGKTMCMIYDILENQKYIDNGSTVVVVAPRILLAEQLCKEFLEVIDDTHTHVMHVHSGETEFFSSTKPEKIALFNNVARAAGENCIIFTTYHSLHRVQEADIEVNTIYFDEAHNSVQRNFFPATEYFASESGRCYFFTATPKHSLSVFKPGMNDGAVYGQVICNVPAPKLVEEGYILPPKVVVKELPMGDERQSDSKNLLDTIDENSLDKILIAARSTKQIVKLLSESDFALQLVERGYSCMYITSKTGAIIDGKKVTREEFFKTLNAWGIDPDKKFVVLHHSILSEGINVKGLEAVLFMRNMDYIGISQSIGRVIRLGGAEKTFGLVCVPVYDKVGINTARSVQAVVDTVFQQGEPAISVVRR